MANEKRLIDANGLMDAFRRYMVERCDRVKCVSEENCKTCEKPCLWRKIVSIAPTVDAVEVVRCKDCVNYCGFEHCKNGICDVDSVSKRAVYPDDFCSYGERREGE